MTAALHQRTLDLGAPTKGRKAKPSKLVRASPPAGLRWLCVDPCSLELPINPKAKLPRMGLAWSYEDTLIAAGSLGYTHASGGEWHVRVLFPGESQPLVSRFASDFLAFRRIMRDIPGFDGFRLGACFLERGFGANPKSVAEQGECRGMLRNAANEAGCEHVLTTPDRSWKNGAGQHYGVKFPNKSDPAKALGLALAREHLRLTLGDSDTDVSDAAMMSVGVPYLGLWPESQEA